MGGKVSLNEAKEALEDLGMWMEARYHKNFVGVPIQKWKMPKNEKEFFTVYTTNIALESGGFVCLAAQKKQKEDVAAFIKILQRLRADQTSEFVRDTLAALKNLSPSEEDARTEKYYALFKKDKVWLKLLDLIGQRTYLRYLLRTQTIDSRGGSIWDPKQWQGRLRDA